MTPSPPSESRAARVRPVCQGCGFEDTATFTRAQLDTMDFRCPECGSIRFEFFREPAQSPSESEARVDASSCPRCPSTDPNVCARSVEDGGSCGAPIHEPAPASESSEEAREALGESCEYGCAGPCEDLQHWKDRAAYLYEVAENWIAEAREPAPPNPPTGVEDARGEDRISIWACHHLAADSTKRVVGQPCPECGVEPTNYVREPAPSGVDPADVERVLELADEAVRCFSVDLVEDRAEMHGPTHDAANAYLKARAALSSPKEPDRG